LDLWEVIRNLEAQSLRTLKKGAAFEILSISDKKIVIRNHSTGNVLIIRKKEIEGACKELLALGKISRVEIEDHHLPRNPAYVVAILSHLLDVTI
jgi:hypothetical protein